MFTEPLVTATSTMPVTFKNVYKLVEFQNSGKVAACMRGPTGQTIFLSGINVIRDQTNVLDG